jgi:hypothetical protein
MPGRLRDDATCPQCGDPLEALIDTENPERLTREYHHGKEPASRKSRRRRFCIAEFVGPIQRRFAYKERQGLEVPQ